MSQAEYARRIGLHCSVVCRQVQAGIIPTHHGMINPAEADRARYENLDPSRGGRHDGETDPEFLEARRRKEVALAGLRELELKVKKGELGPLGKINAWVAGMIIRARDIFLRIGPELRDRLAQESDPGSGERMIDQEVRRGLAEMAEYSAGPPVPERSKADA